MVSKWLANWHCAKSMVDTVWFFFVTPHRKAIVPQEVLVSTEVFTQARNLFLKINKEKQSL